MLAPRAPTRDITPGPMRQPASLPICAHAQRAIPINLLATRSPHARHGGGQRTTSSIHMRIGAARSQTRKGFCITILLVSNHSETGVETAQVSHLSRETQNRYPGYAAKRDLAHRHIHLEIARWLARHHARYHRQLFKAYLGLVCRSDLRYERDYKTDR